MQLPQGVTVAVVDGKKFNLFHNTGDQTNPKLTAQPHTAVDADHKGADAGHSASSANPDGHQADEDGFSFGVANLLNTAVLEGKISQLVVIAAPRTLGELRKHFHPKLTAVLLGEIGKDLTGHSIADVEKTIAAA
ncbi:MAG: host attachment family protein [Caulobacteraceae bacterium]